eukprot:gene21994-28083_t
MGESITFSDGSSAFQGGGIYILLLNSTGGLMNMTHINSVENGGPLLITGDQFENAPPIRYGSRFGTSLANIGDFNNDGVMDLAVVSVVILGDLDHNNVSDIAIGAKDQGDPSSLNPKAGVVFVCLMNSNGTAKHVSRISEFAELETKGWGYVLPVVPNDNCGSALATIGDINLDDKRQHKPTKEARPKRRSIPDLVMGCPQPTGSLPAIPALSDEDVGPPLKSLDQFGSAVAGYWDVDGNGLSELIVGAPGDDEGGSNAGLEINPNKKRKKYLKGENQVYAEEYTL